MGLELKIIDVTDQGKGVAKREQLTYFVEGGKIGQKVLAEVTKYKKNYCEARVIEVLEESPFIQEPECIYANLCDGCSFQDIIYEKQVDIKKSKIINSINRIAGESIEEIDFSAAGSRYNYRNKVELKVSHRGELSYYSRKTNENVAIKNCLVAKPEINEIMGFLQDRIYYYGLRGYDAGKNCGFIKNIMIRVTEHGESMLVMVLNEEKPIADFIMDLRKSGLIDSFYICINSRKNNYKISQHKLIFGREKIIETMGRYKFEISPKSFFQVNTYQAFNIYSDVKRIVRQIQPKVILDLYSGISTTSIILSDSAEKIISVELVDDAVKDGKENACLNNAYNIEFFQADAGKLIDKINLQLKDSMLLIDPPRKGLDPNIIAKIGQSPIDNVVYISCNPATLARDIKAFKEYGFQLNQVKGYDMFVNTLHVETVVLMSRKG